MTDEELQAIRQREQAATPGPWEAWSVPHIPWIPGTEQWYCEHVLAWYDACKTAKDAGEPQPESPLCDCKDPNEVDGFHFRGPAYYPDPEQTVWTEADCEFAAHAREDVPALLAEVDRLRADVREAEGIIRGLVEAIEGRVRPLEDIVGEPV